METVGGDDGGLNDSEGAFNCGKSLILKLGKSIRGKCDGGGGSRGAEGITVEF